MSATKPLQTAVVRSHDTGATTPKELADWIARNWTKIVGQTPVFDSGLGNAAGYKLHSVRVVPLDEWCQAELYSGQPSNCYYGGPEPCGPAPIARRGQLVVEHSGLDLAHKPGDYHPVQERRFEVLLPLGWSGAMDIDLAK